MDKKTTWFEEGLNELGITKEKFKSMTEKEKEETKELLKEFGH